MLRSNGSATPPSVIWFNMAYHAAVLLIHRPFLNEPKGSYTLNFALRSATSAANSISHIVRTYSKCSNFSAVGPQIVDYILSAAVIHLLNATSGRTALGRQSANGLKTCLTALLDMDSKWKIRVELSIRKIQELAHKWSVVWALPLQVSQPFDQRQPNTYIDHTSEAEVLNSSVMENIFEDSDYVENAITDGPLGGTDLWNINQYDSALAQVHMPAEFQDSWNLDFLFDDRGNLVNL
jgi:hypothetical protein